MSAWTPSRRQRERDFLIVKALHERPGASDTELIAVDTSARVIARTPPTSRTCALDCTARRQCRRRSADRVQDVSQSLPALWRRAAVTTPPVIWKYLPTEASR
jgi:hypothetical protein